MRQSQLFLKTQKENPKDEASISAQFLLRGGFIDKLMAGSYTLLPLGFRVLDKIESIIREELNETGAQEMLMPLMHPKDIWEATDRWDTAKEVMFQLEKNGKDYGLSFTHEEVVMDIVRKRNFSYKDLPLKLYHFSTKFRNELRSRSGLLRGVEFLMKDLYSLHTSEEDMFDYYEQVSDAYMKIFKRMGLEIKTTEAGGGVFTKGNTREFQLLSENGEDTIFYCDGCDWAENKEIAKVKEGDNCPGCGGRVKRSRSIEVGNIFPLGTMYAEKMKADFTDKDGNNKPYWYASYGIGTSRLIGAIAETFNDKNGILWPKSVAPFLVHLISLNEREEGEELYKDLRSSGVDVLYDDRRDVSAGEKFAQADLIGIPLRIVVSDKTLEDDSVELKKRSESEKKLIKTDKLLEKLN